MKTGLNAQWLKIASPLGAGILIVAIMLVWACRVPEDIPGRGIGLDNLSGFVKQDNPVRRFLKQSPIFPLTFLNPILRLLHFGDVYAKTDNADNISLFIPVRDLIGPKPPCLIRYQGFDDVLFGPARAHHFQIILMILLSQFLIAEKLGNGFSRHFLGRNPHSAD